MNTFLPYPSFEDTARILDGPRLNKQRSECKQILLWQWPNHPCTWMWLEYEDSLIEYAIEICKECRRRGYQDNLLPYFLSMRTTDQINMPHWLNDEKFHDSHKSNLMRKDPFYYGQFGWDVDEDLPYIWPTVNYFAL